MSSHHLAQSRFIHLLPLQLIRCIVATNLVSQFSKAQISVKINYTKNNMCAILSLSSLKLDVFPIKKWSV